MEQKLFSVNSSSLNVSHKSKTVSLPFILKVLLICDDALVQKGISELLMDVKNIDLFMEEKLAFVSQEFDIALVVFTGNEPQAIADLDKTSLSGKNVLLIGDNIPQALLRRSIQLSLKDILPLDTVEDELLPAILKIANLINTNADFAPVISIINGKGGGGASFITNSLAQVICNHCENKIALFDADLQHGSLADSLNMHPEYFLDDALGDVNELDETAIQAMMSAKGNISLLPVRAYSQLNQLSYIDPDKVTQLLAKLRSNYDLFIADLSRGLDTLSIPIVELSEHIIIVLQQNIASIRESKALIEQLKHKMGISNEKIHIVINRFSEKYSSISVADIQKTTGIKSVFKISNDYQLANACTDLGKSLEEISNSKHLESEVVKLLEVVNPLGIKFSNKSPGFWAKITGKK